MKSNLALLHLYIDTNIIDAADDASVYLRRLWRERWIYLQKTDVMDTELASAPDDRRDRLAKASAPYPEALGAFVLNHSRLNYAVLGSGEDERRLADVFGLLFPNVDRSAARSNHHRDAMHIATAIRYGADGFVTRERRLLNKAERVAGFYNGFVIYSPEEAVGRALELIARRRKLHELEPNRGPLPEWPPDGTTVGNS